MPDQWKCPECGAGPHWHKVDALGNEYCDYCGWNKIPPRLLMSINDNHKQDEEEDDHKDL